MVNRLCLGHACMGSYSCFGEAEEGIDEEGDGFCKEHALYIKETKFDTCVKCATIQECPPEESTIFILSPDGKEKTCKWVPDSDCKRCKGTGIEPLSKEYK